jgi:thioesterase domain-containing protein
MELASQAETQGLAAETVIMLDPYTPPHPRAGVSENEAAQGQSEGLEAYYRVMKSALPGRIQNDLHVILASNSKNADHASEYWQHLTAGRLHLGEVGGTHESYLRRDGAQTVALLNEVLLRKTGTAAEAALGDDVGRRA